MKDGAAKYINLKTTLALFPVTQKSKSKPTIYFMTIEYGRRLKQRQHLKAAFLRGLKFWGLAKQVRVYAARDLTPRSRDITWYSENLLGEFGEGGGGAGNGAIKSVSSSHTKEKKDGRQWGIF